MYSTYNRMKGFYPCATHIKKRREGDFLIVISEDLEIQYFNEVAMDFYLKFDGKRTVEKIVTELLDEYEVEKSTLESDAVSLIRDLQWKNLIILKERECQNETISEA